MKTHTFEVDCSDDRFNSLPVLSINQLVDSRADKATQTEFFEAICSDDVSNSSPVQSREDSPLHQITCSLCKYKHSYQYQATHPSKY